MKTPALVALLLAAAAVLFLAGCVTGRRASADGPLIQTVLAAMLPADFAGPVHLEHRNQYFTIVIDAANVRRVDDKWTWEWLEYERTSSIPLFSGVTWSSTGKVRLGAPPTLPK